MNRRSLATVSALLLALAWLTGGCSDSPQRQAGKNLRRQVAESQRSREKAIALLGSPVYGVGGQVVPLPGVDPEKVDANMIVLHPPGAVNDNALKLLDAGPLDQAIKDNPEANAPDLSLALGQAGRIHELRGLCFAWQASAARGRIQDLLEESRPAVSVLRTLAGSRKVVQAYIDALSSDANARDLAAWAQGQAGQKAAKLQAIDAEIQKLKDKVKTVRGNLEKLSKEAGELRLESKSASGKKGLDLAEQAIDKQAEANKAASELAAAESELAAKLLDRDNLASEEAQAKAMVGIGQSSLKGRQDAAAMFRGERDLIDGNIAQWLAKLDGLAGDVAGLIKEADKHEAAARGAFAEANHRFKAAQEVWAGIPVVEGADRMVRIDDDAQRAALCMAQADMARAGLVLRARLDELAAEVKQLWPGLGRPGEMPEVYAGLGPSYLPDPAKTRDDAQKLCLDAIGAYREMVMKVGPNVRWTYQALVGTSYLCLYDLGKDRANLVEAASNLSEAVKDKESSPYLTSVVEVNRHVQELLKSAPGG